MSESLYRIADQYLADMRQLESMDIDDVTFTDTLDGLAGDLEVKATNVALFVRNLESFADQIKLAEQGMTARRKAIENKADRIRQYLLDNMQRTGITKIDSPWFSLTVKKNPPSVVIDSLQDIPASMMVQPLPPPPSPDKKAISAALKAGQEVAGAHLESGVRLEIK